MIPSSVELGQIMFSPNIIHPCDCPKWVIALLKDIEDKLSIVMWNIHQKEYESPFANTGNEFIGKNFEVHAYNWNDDITQDYNFKYKDIEISWYKYLGRGTTVNSYHTADSYIKMYNDCIKELEKMNEEHLDEIERL